MKFNEDNVTEQMCIEIAQKAGYTYIPADELRMDKSTVLVECLFKDAIMRMNPITEQEAQIVIEKVKARIMSGMSGDIVTANQALQKLFFDQNSFPFDHDGTGFTNIRFFDENPKTHKKNNSYVVTNQWEYPKSSYAGGKRLDIVLLINGLLMVIGEVKTATNVNVSWADGAKDICDYQKSLPEMFVSNILSFATEGRELYYAGVGTPLGKWGPWFATEERPHGALKDVRENLASLIDPLRLLEIYRFFSVYTTEKSSSKKIKIVCRYQQYYGGKAIVDRVMSSVETGIGLLTGFDAPILQCMYLDKPMKEHTLLQAICRTNRTYDAKKKCINDEKRRNKAIIEIKKILILRLGNPEHRNDARMKALSEKLKELQEKMRQNQIDSIDFLKQLLDIAKQVLERERELNQPEDKRKQAKAALTELFESIKTKDTPIAVERVVNDIDHQVVDIIRRFPNAFKAVSGKQEIRKSLRSILWLKYKIKDGEVYEKACQYVEQYYPGVEITSYEIPAEKQMLTAAEPTPNVYDACLHSK